MKLLFASGYFYKLDSKQWKTQQPYPPLGTIQAAAVARAQGHSVDFFDCSLTDSPDDIIVKIESLRPDYLFIWDDGFNYLTKMCLTVMREAAFRMVQLSKERQIPVVVSSSDSSDHYEKYLEQGASVIIRGEGENTLKELLGAWGDGKSLDLISGLAFIQATKTIVTPVREVMKDLDSLPLPAWDLIDIDAYRRIWMQAHGYFSLNLATTRGCPYKCNWCAKPIYGNRYHSRSVEHVTHEIEYLLNTFQPDHFWMADDIFGLKPGWVKLFSQEVNRKGLKFKYKIQSRVDLLLEADTIDALAMSGAETVWVGAESGSQKILDAMDKGTEVHQIATASQLLRKKGIHVGFFIQFGYPGETMKDIDETVKMVMKLVPDEIGVSVSYPLPGTKFYEKVKADLKVKQNWNDSDDLALMFRNTHSPAFYKILHRFLHARYRVQRGLRQVKSWLASPFTPTWQTWRTLASMVYHIPVTLFRMIQLRQWQ